MSSKMSLKLSEETLNALLLHGKTVFDVETVLFSVDGFLRRCSIEAFLCAAEKIMYAPCIGLDEDIVIAGLGGEWWLERDNDNNDNNSGNQVWKYKEGFVDINYKNATWPPPPSQLLTI